jgi:N-acetyltransferase 10
MIPSAGMLMHLRTLIRLALPHEWDASRKACDTCMPPVPSLCCRFVLDHPLVASAVVGASTLQQLQELLQAAAQGPLQDEQLLADIDSIHQRYPSPTP